MLAIHTKTEQITIKMANVVPACWSLNVADMRQVTSLFIHPQLLYLHASTKKVNKFGNDTDVYTESDDVRESLCPKPRVAHMCVSKACPRRQLH